MIKISANISKKVPIPGMEYSSQQFGAAMEIEVSDADKADAIQTRIQELYGLLSNSIDAQITGAAQLPCPALQAPPAFSQPVQSALPPAQQRIVYANGNGRNRIAGASTNGNGTGRRSTNATEAQCRAIFAICKSQGLDMAAVLADYNVADAKDLHVKTASTLIDQLKASQTSNGASH